MSFYTHTDTISLSLSNSFFSSMLSLFDVSGGKNDRAFIILDYQCINTKYTVCVWSVCTVIMFSFFSHSVLCDLTPVSSSSSFCQFKIVWLDSFAHSLIYCPPQVHFMSCMNYTSWHVRCGAHAAHSHRSTFYWKCVILCEVFVFISYLNRCRVPFRNNKCGTHDTEKKGLFACFVFTLRFLSIFLLFRFIVEKEKNSQFFHILLP